MFKSLCLIECKQTLRSLVYYIYVVLFVLFIMSQMGGTDIAGMLEAPRPGQDYYGLTYTDDAQIIMESTLISLLEECSANSYATYPVGFIRNVTLNEEEQGQIRNIIAACTGRSYEEVWQEWYDYWNRRPVSDSFEGYLQDVMNFKLELKDGLTYEEFEGYMKQACSIIGSGSSYENDTYEHSAERLMTYEEALQEYEAFLDVDRVTGAYMRLFCDYAGIVLAILPIFVGVTRCLKDKRAKAAEVLYAKPVSSGMLMASRYVSAVLMVFLPVVVLALVEQLPVQFAAKGVEVSPDVMAFLKYTCVWLLPEIMTVLAVSFFITELTDSVVGIFLQVIWGYGGLISAKTLVGDFGLKLIPRWNGVGDTENFRSQLGSLLWNRGYYFLLALLCMVATVLIYEWKRKKGGSVIGTIRRAGR